MNIRNLFLSASLIVLSAAAATAQWFPVVVVTGQVTDPNGPVGGQVILVTIAPTPGTIGGGTPITRTVVTGASGHYADSIPSTGTTGTITVATLNCNGTTLMNTLAFTPNNGPMFTMTSNFTLCAGTGTNPLACTASWVVDTNQLQPGVVNIINACSTTVTGPATNVLTNYLWDFGDGNSATGAYPSHFYTQPGKYQVCVTMGSVATAFNASCTASFCDSIEVDANGYLVYKGQAGFQLNIIDASQVSLVETNFTAPVAYPNPVASGTELRWTAEQPTHVRITSADGRVLADEHAPRSLPTSGWAPGVYYITAVGTQNTTTQTLVVY
jgi:hypothetical protein